MDSLISYFKKNTGSVLVILFSYFLGFWESFTPSGKLFQRWLEQQAWGLFNPQNFFNSVIFVGCAALYATIVYFVVEWKIEQD
jgi:hypothetical protein